MSEAEVTLEKLLRPAWNFELDYASNLINKMPAVGGDVPILFTYPSGPRPSPGLADTSILDPEGKLVTPPPGVSPLLAKFVPCAIGQTQVFYFPVVPKWGLHVANSSPGEFCYVWRVVWRMRSLADYKRRKNDRLPYSVPRDTFGAQDTRWADSYVLPDRPTTLVSTAAAGNLPGRRIVKPGVMESAIYARSLPDPTQEVSPYHAMLMPDAVAIPSTVDILNKTARYPGTGMNYQAYALGVLIPTLDMQTGIFTAGPITSENLNASYPATAPMHLPKAVRCNGNEFAVECFKFNWNQGLPDFNSPRNWDFIIDPITSLCTGGEDFMMSLMFGIGQEGRVDFPEPVTADCGVRVIAGVVDA